MDGCGRRQTIDLAAGSARRAARAPPAGACRRAFTSSARRPTATSAPGAAISISSRSLSRPADRGRARGAGHRPSALCRDPTLPDARWHLDHRGRPRAPDPTRAPRARPSSGDVPGGGARQSQPGDLVQAAATSRGPSSASWTAQRSGTIRARLRIVDARERRDLLGAAGSRDACRPVDAARARDARPRTVPMWGVLGISRLHYTLATGRIASKSAAGEHARSRRSIRAGAGSSTSACAFVAARGTLALRQSLRAAPRRARRSWRW